MTCADANANRSAYFDGELALADVLDYERHASACADCAAADGEARALRDRVRAEAPVYPASAHLRARILDGIGARPARRWNWFAAGGWATAAALAAALALVLWLPRGAGNFTGLAQAVEASHVRSLEAGHLMDVASTDQHTVKPWFHGKLDYAPPVEDFAAQGFALIGGRLDYLNHRPVAALVYQHKLHLINVFVWPEATPGALEHLDRDGYTLYSWSAAGMRTWIISDADAAALRQLARLLGVR